MRTGTVILRGGERLVGVHSSYDCTGRPCCIHRPSNHSMRKFAQHWRGDRGIMERICKHGVGHPDPDDYRIRLGEDSGVHGCDGCCSSIATLQSDQQVVTEPGHETPGHDSSTPWLDSAGR